MIAGGKVLASGSPDEIHNSDSPYVQQFLRGQPDGPVAFHYKASAFADDLMNKGERA